MMMRRVSDGQEGEVFATVQTTGDDGTVVFGYWVRWLGNVAGEYWLSTDCEEVDAA